MNFGSNGISGSVLQYLTRQMSSDLKVDKKKNQTFNNYSLSPKKYWRIGVSKSEVTYRFSTGLTGLLSLSPLLTFVWIVGAIVVTSTYQLFNNNHNNIDTVKFINMNLSTDKTVSFTCCHQSTLPAVWQISALRIFRAELPPLYGIPTHISVSHS